MLPVVPSKECTVSLADTHPVCTHWQSVGRVCRNCRGLLVEQYLDKTKPGTSAVELPAGHSRQLLWNRYIAAANSALRYVAAEEGLTLIDYESIMLQLPTAHAHFPDGFHPLVRVMAALQPGHWQGSQRCDSAGCGELQIWLYDQCFQLVSSLCLTSAREACTKWCSNVRRAGNSVL